MQAALPVYYLDGESLTPEMVCRFVNVLIFQLMELGYRKYKLDLSAEAWAKVDVCCLEGFSYVQSGRPVVDDIVANKITKYGINTGFGNFKDVIIPPELTEELQVNLIRSHASGVGDNLSYERSLRMLALRCNVLAKGNSGVSHESLQRALGILCLCFIIYRLLQCWCCLCYSFKGYSRCFW